jgi:hypothetical protein
MDPSDEHANAAADDSNPGPGEGEQGAEGAIDTGVDDRGPEPSGSGETPGDAKKPNAEESSEDADDALTKALQAGSLDELDADGEVKKDAKKPGADAGDKTPKKDEQPKGDDAGDKAGDKPGPDELTAEEKELIAKAPSKKAGKELDSLFKERRALRKQTAEATEREEKQYKPAKAFAEAIIAHATDAGLVTENEGRHDFERLRTVIEQEKYLRTLPSDRVAAYYRKLADDISPLPKAVELPEDLADLVELKTISKDEAESIARGREEAKRPKQQEPPPVRQDQTKRDEQPKPAGPTKAQVDAGIAKIGEITGPFIKRFPSEWKEIGAKVMERLKPKMAKSDPAVWGDLAETEIELEIARRKPAPKTPPKTPRPGGAPPKRSSEVLSEEDEAAALVRGDL